MISVQTLINFVTEIEGPYKWYVIAGAILLLTIIFNRLVFKTLKWVFIAIGLAVIIIAFLKQFNYF